MKKKRYNERKGQSGIMCHQGIDRGKYAKR